MKKTIEDLKAIREETLKTISLRSTEGSVRVVVGMGTCGISAGARAVLNSLVDEVNKRELSHVQIVQTGCIGMCRIEPMFDVYKDNKKVTYVNMTPEKARQVVVEHLANNYIIKEYTIGLEEESN